MNTKLVERRQSPRVRTHLPVRLYKGSEPRAIETLTMDLASQGVRCLSPVPVSVSSEMGVEIVPGPGQEPIALRGRTAWFHTVPDSEQFELGIAFVDMPSQAARRLSAYLDRFLA